VRHRTAFWLDADVSIVLSARATDETVATARLLQTAIQVATGLLLPIRRTLRPLEESRSIVLLRADRDGPVPSTDLASMGPEGYALSIGQQRLLVLATAERGLFYGVQTLRQLLRTQGRLLPALSIRDWPVLPNRGVMLDVSRGKVPTLETLFRLVENLAAYKYNHVQLYIEHPFHFPSHPEIGAGSDPLTADDILALDAHCRAHHVELVPNLQSFGHLRRLLSLPRYAHLDEVGWQWSLTPAREETYQLLDELYADFLPNFTSSWLNVDCDETWDLGTGQSRALAERLGKGRLYLQHILRVRDLAAKYGRRIMVWADILLHFPDLVAELPDDIVLLDWWYEAQDHYPSAALLGSLGRTFWVCPGTSSWNTLFPRIENAIGNIRTFVRDGLAAGASGMLLTDWGDYGHYQLLSLSWYPYLFGAAVARHNGRSSSPSLVSSSSVGWPMPDGARSTRRSTVSRRSASVIRLPSPGSASSVNGTPAASQSMPPSRPTRPAPIIHSGRKECRNCWSSCAWPDRTASQPSSASHWNAKDCSGEQADHAAQHPGDRRSAGRTPSALRRSSRSGVQVLQRQAHRPARRLLDSVTGPTADGSCPSSRSRKSDECRRMPPPSASGLAFSSRRTRTTSTDRASSVAASSTMAVACGSPADASSSTRGANHASAAGAPGMR
jgi:hypothetical protein